MSKTSQLHELLAVMTDLETVAKKTRDEAIHTFTKKQQHFAGACKTLTMFSEERKQEEESQKVIESLTTTVNDKLDYIRVAQEKWYDALLQMESTNQNAVADLVVEGNVIAEKVPATFLLGMEGRLKALRVVFDSIPTQNPSFEWILDPEKGKNVYVTANPITSQKQEKEFKFITLAEATKEHPAQVEKVTENKVVGMFTTRHWTGTITPSKKSDYLEKIDTLIRAVKKARQRANSTEVVKRNIGKQLLDYILGD